MEKICTQNIQVLFRDYKKKKEMKRIKHNDLTHYFMRPHEDLPAAYLASCKKFFNGLRRASKKKFDKQDQSHYIGNYKKG